MSIVITTIIKTDWQSHQSTLSNLRETVFIKEQHVPLLEELDGKDDSAIHYLILANKLPIGCARMITTHNSAKIGRVCVLSDYRKHKIATQLMFFIIDDAKNQGILKLELEAQTYIIPFYEKLGFSVLGEEFMDAGILHKKMELFL